jgi:hypothetical protein
VSVKIHLVAFSVTALFIVVYCYAAWTMKQYILPKCWYPPIKVRYIDTIGYLQFLSNVAYFNVTKLQFFVPGLGFPSYNF